MNSKGNIKTRPFDSAEFLDTPEAIAAYLADALNSGSSAEFQDALNVVARTRGMTEIVKTKIRSKPRAGDDHGPKAKTPARRSVFLDLFPAEEAAELEIRSTLLNGLKHWLASSGMTRELIPCELDEIIEHGNFEQVFEIRKGKRSQGALRRELLAKIYDFRSGHVHAGLRPSYRGMTSTFGASDDIRRGLFAEFSKAAILGYLLSPRSSLVGQPRIEAAETEPDA